MSSGSESKLKAFQEDLEQGLLPPPTKLVEQGIQIDYFLFTLQSRGAKRRGMFGNAIQVSRSSPVTCVASPVFILKRFFDHENFD